MWAALDKRVEALENTPQVDLAPLEDATRNLSDRVTALESKPAPEPFDPTDLKTQLAELQAHLTPVELVWLEGPGKDIAPIYDNGANVTVVQHAGRVNINIYAYTPEGLLHALDGLKLPHFPKVAEFSDPNSYSGFDVEVYQGRKFLTKLDREQIRLSHLSGTLAFRVKLDEVLAVMQETGADCMNMSAFYYTNELPPETTE